MTEKCCYCDKPIKGFYGQDYVISQRFPLNFKQLITERPAQITLIREWVCKDCFKSIKNDHRRERSYNPDIEIYDTENLND